MSYKIIYSLAIIAVSSGAVISPLGSPVLAKFEDYDPHPQYTFAYDVQDAITGDSKAQYETRNGDIVQGSYSLIEPDGTRRIVDYTADPINGFNAIVNREPAVAIAPVVRKTILTETPIVHLTTKKLIPSPVSTIISPVNTQVIAKYSTPTNVSPIARITAPLTYAAAGYTR